MLEYLAILPVLHFGIIYFQSLKEKVLKQLKKVYAVMYLDWLFIPFNYMIASSAKFSLVIFLILMFVSIIVSYMLNIAWLKRTVHKDAGFFIKKEGFTNQGMTHLIFMILQGTIVGTVYLSPATSSNYVFLMGILFLYLIGHLIISGLINRIDMRKKAETPLIYVGLVMVIIRTLINIIY